MFSNSKEIFSNALFNADEMNDENLSFLNYIMFDFFGYLCVWVHIFYLLGYFQ